MDLYVKSYLRVLRRDFMLVAMAFVLLAVTFGIWAGVPFFLIGSFVGDFTSNVAIIYFSISLSGGFLVSVYFVPFHLNVAKYIAGLKSCNPVRTFGYLQLVWVVVSSFAFGLVLTIVFQL